MSRTGRYLLLSVFFLLFINNVKAQELPKLDLTSSDISQLKKGAVQMGFNMGLANIEGSTGFAVGAFVELGFNNFFVAPTATYWKVEETTNFELAGLLRYKFPTPGLKPYIDGGLGVNFLGSGANNFTKLSINVGGGVELAPPTLGFSLVGDVKYKIIITEKGALRDEANLSGLVFTVGAKFPL